MEKKDLQETIQHSFEHECRCYASYVESLNWLKEKIRKIEYQCNKIKEREETIRQILEMKHFLSSEEFEKMKKTIKFFEKNDGFIEAIRKSSETNEFDEDKELKRLESQQDMLVRLKDDKERILKEIRCNIMNIISDASANAMKLTISMDISEVACKAFVYYFREDYHFKRERNIIDIKRSCYLPREFLKAYLEKGENVEKALEWFESEARIIKF